jgi:Phospholipase_D-nuclease N-terminal
MRNLLAVAVVGLVVYTIIDVVRSEAEERYGIARALWILLIVVLPVVGSITWLVARQAARSRGAGGAGGSGGGGSRRGPSPSGPRRPPGPLAPDDDPEFLWRLEQQQRRRRKDDADGAPPAAPSDPESDGPTTRRS